MNEDPKFWEETVLPWIQDLKAKNLEVRKLMDQLEHLAYDKAGYAKVAGVYHKKPDNWPEVEWVALKNELNYWQKKGEKKDDTQNISQVHGKHCNS